KYVTLTPIAHIGNGTNRKRKLNQTTGSRQRSPIAATAAFSASAACIRAWVAEIKDLAARPASARHLWKTAEAAARAYKDQAARPPGRTQDKLWPSIALINGRPGDGDLSAAANMRPSRPYESSHKFCGEGELTT
ncbi:hypothetical protein HPP92_028794, partial [Vanilla planifolia]